MTASRSVWAVLLALAGVAACASPEAGRARGGDSGADPGNRGAVIEIHDSRVYYGTPCRLPTGCRGAMPAAS